MALRTRRTFLSHAAAGLAAATLLANRATFARQAVSLSHVAIDDSLTLITGAGGNVVVNRGPEGLVFVDGGNAASSAALLAYTRRLLGSAPVQILFNTHWHPEQTGCNEALGKRGVRIIAHENTRLWLSTEFHVDWQNRTYAPLSARARPTESFYTKDATQFGSRSIEYGHLPAAHTDGDLYVRFVESNVIVVGGALSARRYPEMDYATGGWLGGVVDASTALLSLTDAETRIVAAEGGILSRADIQSQLEMATRTRERIVAAMKKGLSAADMYEEGVTRDFDAQWGDPTFFLKSSYRGLWGHLRELGIA